MIGVSRPNRATLSAAAFRRNLAALQAMLPARTGIWQVCKGEGYGMGTVTAASLGAACGITRFCAGTPEEALALREAFPEARVLLFPSAAPEDLPELAARRITLTLHNMASLEAVLTRAPAAACWIKLDCGLHRFGFAGADWPRLLNRLRDGGLPGLEGIYTHFSQSGSAGAIDAALALFDHRLSEARRVAGHRLASMVAASPLLLARPGLAYDFVDPGRALYGMLREEAAGVALSPVVTAIHTRLLDSRRLEPGETVGYGTATGHRPERVGTIPIGHFDGLGTEPPLGDVRLHGRAAPVLARTLLSSIIDLSAIPEARDGDTVAIVDGHHNIHALAASLGSSTTHLHFGLVRALPKTLDLT